MSYLRKKTNAYIPTTVSQSNSAYSYSYAYFIDTDIDLNDIAVQVTDYRDPSGNSYGAAITEEINTTEHTITFFEEGSAKVKFSADGVDSITVNVSIYAATGAYTYVGDIVEINNQIRQIPTVTYIDRTLSVKSDDKTHIKAVGNYSLQLDPIIPDITNGFVSLNAYDEATFNTNNNEFGTFEIIYTVKDNSNKPIKYGIGENYDYHVEVSQATQTGKYVLVDTPSINEFTDIEDNTRKLKIAVKFRWANKAKWVESKAGGSDYLDITFINNVISSNQKKESLIITTPITEALRNYFAAEKQATVGDFTTTEETQLNNATSASFNEFSVSLVQFTYPIGYEGMKYIDQEWINADSTNHKADDWTVVDTFGMAFIGNNDNIDTMKSGKCGIHINTNPAKQCGPLDDPEKPYDYSASIINPISKNGLFRISNYYPSNPDPNNQSGIFTSTGDLAFQFQWNDQNTEAINTANLKGKEQYKIEDYFEVVITVGSKTTTLYVCVSATPGSLQAKPINALNFGGNIFNIEDRNAVTIKQLAKMMGISTIGNMTAGNEIATLKGILSEKLTAIANDINNIWSSISNNASETTDLGDVVNQYRTQLEANIDNVKGENAAQVYKLSKQLRHLESLIEALGGSVTAIDDNYDDSTNTLSITLTDTRAK